MNWVKTVEEKPKTGSKVCFIALYGNSVYASFGFVREYGIFDYKSKSIEEKKNVIYWNYVDFPGVE